MKNDITLLDQNPVISVSDQKIEYKDSSQTILTCLENANIEVHFHCRDGFCGACRVTLLSGEINYPKGEPLAFIGDAEILPCCCVPVTNISLLIED